MNPRQRSSRAAHVVLLVCCLLFAAAGTVRAHESGFGNKVMWNACESRKVDDRCAFESVDHDVYRGTCQAMSNALACVRNQPIEHAARSSHTHQHDRHPATTSTASRWWSWLAGLFILLMGGVTLFGIKREAAA